MVFTDSHTVHYRHTPDPRNEGVWARPGEKVPAGKRRHRDRRNLNVYGAMCKWGMVGPSFMKEILTGGDISGEFSARCCVPSLKSSLTTTTVYGGRFSKMGLARTSSRAPRTISLNQDIDSGPSEIGLVILLTYPRSKISGRSCNFSALHQTLRCRTKTNLSRAFALGFGSTTPCSAGKRSAAPGRCEELREAAWQYIGR